MRHFLKYVYSIVFTLSDDSKDLEVNEIAIVAIHTSPNDAVKEVNALDEVRKWVTKRYSKVLFLSLY